MEKYGQIEEIVWDGDNTIWDWVTYAVHSYETMCSVISQEIGKTEDEVAAAMKRFYTKVGTMEHEGLIQGMRNEGFFNGLPIYDQALILKVQNAFTQKRKEHLRTYPGIYNAIKTVHGLGIKNTILTDAPAFQAKMRLKRSHLNLHIDHVNAMPTAYIPNLPQEFKDKEAQGRYSVDFKITEIPVEKPHSNLEEILNRTRKSISEHIVIIGDNDQKDMELARIYGCRGIHAIYGIAKPELLRRIKRFAPEKVAAKNSAIANITADKAAIPDQIYQAGKSTDILPILEKLIAP